MRKSLPFLLIITVVVIFTYWQLPQTFFQQDEWHTFSDTIWQQSQGFRHLLINFWKPTGLAHSLPLTRTFNFILFNLFFPSTSAYAVASIAIHLVNVFLVYWFIFLLTQKKFLSFLGTLFFAVNATASQATTWLGTFTGTETSVTFLLLTLILFWKFTKKGNWRYYWLSLITLLISLLSKETTIFLFAFLPIFYLIHKQPKKLKKLTFLKVVVPLGALCAIFLFPRFLTTSPETAVAGVGAGGAKMVAYNFLTIPIKTLEQIFVPARVTFALSEKLLPKFYPFIAESYKNLSPYDFVVKNILADQISLVFGLIFLVGIIMFAILRSKVTKDPVEVQSNIGILHPAVGGIQNDILFGFLFILFSTLPFTILGKQDAYLPSRHYYIPAIGGGILLTSIFSMLFSLIGRLERLTDSNLIREFREGLGNLAVFTILTLFSLYILGNLQSIRSDVENQVKLGNLRSGIINQIMNEHPVLPEKIVFYVDGNAEGFYGVNNLKVPFQSGFGNVLLVNYFERGQIPPEFFANEFLWEILEQGYKETTNHLPPTTYHLPPTTNQIKGFGYFWEEEKLKEAMNTYGLTEENVISYFYDAENEELKRISNCSNCSN